MRYALLTTSWLPTHDMQRSVVENYSDGVVRHTLQTQPPGEYFTYSQVMSAPGIIHLQPSTRRKYTALILENIIAVFPHDSGPIIRIEKGRPRIASVYAVAEHDPVDPIFHQHGRHEFESRMGRPPANWELDRINCPNAGQIGHYACGWCDFHSQPVIVCGCRVRNDDR